MRGRSGVRTWPWLLLVGSAAQADPLRLHAPRLAEAPDEPALHVDLTSLQRHSWHAGGERSYQLGPFRLAAVSSIDQLGDSSRRSIGLFAYKTFRLSRWMHAWIGLGIVYEQLHDPAVFHDEQGVTIGLTLGTTFR